MWFLEHESLFGGRRIWLRPGSQHLFGRTKPNDGDRLEGKQVFIDNKNVSRKHMMIKVLNIRLEDGTKLHARSQLEITDLSCRQGTVIDDAHALKSKKEADGTISYDKASLSGTEHTVKLSSTYPPFKIKWQGMVFTYAGKERKENHEVNAQLHAIDIKTSSEFVIDKTTHVVSQKRNLPKVLQGLVSGKPVVTTDYLDAILHAAKRSLDENENYIPSNLEEDFDSYWPKEKEYIPPAGAEPVPRPDQMFNPDPSRAEVFSGLTFVFSNESQYSNLHQVIAGGGGKALHFEVDPGKTTVEEYVDYVKSIAGQKKRSKSSNDSLPVVTIRLSNYPDGLEDWARSFVAGVDRALNQRSILKNEFLDAIVTNDTSSLRKPPADIMQTDHGEPLTAESARSMRGHTPVSQPRSQSQALEAESIPAEEPVKTNPRKRPIRRGVTSRFTGFDDYEPPTKARKIDDTATEDVQDSMPAQGLPSQSESSTQARRSARSQPKENVEIKEQLDNILPAAAAVKRQRAATRGPSALVEPESRPSAAKPKSKTELIEEMQKVNQKAEKEINVREAARKRVKEEDEKRRAEEESLREALEGVDISEIRAKIKVEEMQLRSRSDRPNSQSQMQSDRWNPDWNGRKNFKKFRPKGAGQGVQSQKVLVTFEEAPQKKGFGDDAFFLEDTEPPVRTKQDERRLKRRIGGGAESESEPETGFTRRKRTKPAAEVINVEDSGLDEEENGRHSGPRSSGRTQRVAETQLEDTQTQSSRKRGPVSVAAGQPSSKRSRNARRDDDSDGEETGFRFRRRG